MREMYQCEVCEDWYHDGCLHDLPDPSRFEHLVCGACIEESYVLRVIPNFADSKGPFCLTTETTSTGNKYLKGTLKEVLCKCASCKEAIAGEPALDFILNDVPVWEPQPDTCRTPSLDAALQTLSRNHRLAVDRGLYGLNDFATGFAAFLKGCKLEMGTVRKEVPKLFTPSS